jgi:hypothetical protein
MAQYLQQVRALAFDERPDYAGLRRMIRAALKRTDVFDYAYDWFVVRSVIQPAGGQWHEGAVVNALASRPAKLRQPARQPQFATTGLHWPSQKPTGTGELPRRGGDEPRPCPGLAHAVQTDGLGARFWFGAAGRAFFAEGCDWVISESWG